MCQRASKRVNVPKLCQFFNLACQRGKRHANFLFLRANVPKGVPIFQTFFLRNAKGNFFTLLFYKKFYIILDVIVIHMISICIVQHFYTSCHIKKKCAELIFGTFLFFS